MGRTTRILFFLAFAALAAVPDVEARELDREKTVSTEQIQAGQRLPRTLIVRRRIGSSRVEVLHSSRVLRPERSRRDLISTSSFERLDSRGRPVRELDRDSSSSSWWFSYSGYYGFRPYSYYPYSYYPSTYYPSYYYPTYSYWGYNYVYRPYYWYNWGGYSYAYYGWPYYNSYCWY